MPSESASSLFSEVVPGSFIFEVKGALSDPLAASGVIAGAICKPDCLPTAESSHEWVYKYKACNFVAFLSVAGEIYQSIDGIISSFKDENTLDYCDRIEEE